VHAGFGGRLSGKGPQQRDLAGQPTLPKPYHKGGRTCACNTGARSRKCHRIKQSKGWSVTQPKPGYHQWTTPTGRVYTQEPKRYPALRSRHPTEALLSVS
jgi:hypothetical protein